MIEPRVPFLDEINPLPCICVEVDNKLLGDALSVRVEARLKSPLDCFSLLFTVKSLEEPLNSKLLDVPTDSSLLLLSLLLPS